MSDDSSVQSTAKINVWVPHSARVWNYWLGGKDNYEVDRAMGDRVAEMLPSIPVQARNDRLFLRRVVGYLAGEQKVRQFLDIGTGLPTVDNTHEVAQRVAPECRIVYVDHDPLVLSHARALLTSTVEGECNYVDADLLQPEEILSEAAKTLDFMEPVALMLLGIVHHVTDTAKAYAVVKTLVDALPEGSFVAINHATNAIHGEKTDRAVEMWNAHGTPKIRLRSPVEIAGFLHGLDLVPPGVVSCSRWGVETMLQTPEDVDEFCGVARKRGIPG